MPKIIEQFRVLIYSGDFDAQIPHTGTEEWTRGLGYNESASWHPWYVGAEGESSVAGYAVEYDVPTEFTFLTVKAAGHMVPTFRPRAGLQMLAHVVQGTPFAPPVPSDAVLTPYGDIEEAIAQRIEPIADDAVPKACKQAPGTRSCSATGRRWCAPRRG